MGYRSSGNLTVDAMGSIAISGNVIPEEWYKHILKPTTGKPLPQRSFYQPASEAQKDYQRQHSLMRQS